MTFDSGTFTSTRTDADICASLHKRSCKKTPWAEQIELTLDSDVVDALYALGEDWEVHFNAILREWLRTNPTLI